MNSDYVNNQVRKATEVEVMPLPISDEIASYVAAMAENQAISLSQRTTKLDVSNQASAVSTSFSVTDEHGRQIKASASISFKQ